MILGIFAVTALANAQTASLTLGSGSGVPGSNVPLNLALAAGGTQPAALQWTLEFSSADITGVSGSIGAAANSAGKSLTCTTASGSAMCVIFGFNQSAIADGTVAQLTFTLAPGTSSTSTAIQVTQVVLSDSAGTSIPVSVTAGSITVVQAVPAVVSGLSCTPSSLNPGGTSACVATLNQAAPGSGSAIALSSNNANVSVPASVTVVAGATTASFTATAGSFTSSGSAQITASLNGGTASASLTLTALAQVSALNCTPSSLSPGGTSACVVTLNQAAPGSGAAIALSSNNVNVSVPASVTVAASATTASFTATAGSFTSSGTAQITASLNAGTASASLALTPLTQVSALNCTPSSLSPGGTSACVATLNQAAPGSGAVIALSSNNANLSVPVSVTAAAGATSASFTATAGSFTSSGTAQISALLNGSTASASLTLTALAKASALSCTPSSLSPNGTSACVVTLNQAAPGSGAAIALSSNNANLTVPASVTAAAGATSASFTATAGSFTTDGSAQITASLNGGTASASLTLAALSQVSALSCSPPSLNSGSTASCVVTLTKPAPSSGASIALSSNSANVSVPASVTAIAGATTATFTATAGSFTTSGSAQITASLNGRSQVLTLALTVSGGSQLSSVTCNPTTFNAGNSSTCTVKLSGALSSNANIQLSSSAANVSVPAWIAIASGQTSAQFTVSSTLADLDTNAVVTASLGSISRTVTLTAIGLRPTVLTCSPQSLTSGGSAKCTVQLNRAPGTKQLTLRVTSSSAAVQVPQSLSTKNQQVQYSFTAKAATFPPPGTVLLSVAYLTSVASTSVTVISAAAPVLAAPARMTTTVDTPVSITAQAEDLSGLNVNLSADNLPAGASFTVDNGSTASPATPGVSGVIQWMPQANQVGTYSVKLGAKSAAGTTSQKLTIQVTAQVPHINAVVNAASLSTQQVCSPGSLAVIQGTALQLSTASSGDPADQTSVTVGGATAEVTDASATQITFRCPENNASQKLALQVSNRFGASNTTNVNVQNGAPGIFTLDASGTGQGVILVNGTSNLAALPDPDFPGQVAAPGDALTLLMTGLPEGLPATSTAQVTIGQITAEVLSVAGDPKNPGVQMLTVRVPQSVPVGDSIPVQVLSPSANMTSNTVTIAIEQAN